MKLIFVTTLFFFAAVSAQAKTPKKLTIEKTATIESFKEFSEACKTGKVKKDQAGKLVEKFSTRMDEWDVPALLVTKQYCASGELETLVLTKLSQDALMKYPKNLLQAMIEEKVTPELLKQIADNNLADTKDCKGECLQRETLAFEQRMEKITGLELNTTEREMRDRLLSEMRLAFGKLKEKNIK